jgi:hypothetical protein
MNRGYFADLLTRFANIIIDFMSSSQLQVFAP